MEVSLALSARMALRVAGSILPKASSVGANTWGGERKKGREGGRKAERG